MGVTFKPNIQTFILCIPQTYYKTDNWHLILCYSEVLPTTNTDEQYTKWVQSGLKHPALFQQGQEGNRRKKWPVETKSKRPPLFCPLWSWCCKTDVVATVANVCHRHLRVCGIGSWYAMLVYSLEAEESHPPICRSVVVCGFICVYVQMCLCFYVLLIFNMWPMHVGSLSVCVC